MEPLQMNEKTAPELPHGWVWTTLGEICLNSQYGWTTSAKSEGEYHLLRTTDITSGNINWNSVPFCKEIPSDVDKYLIKDGDIVISRAGSVGYSHLIRDPKDAIFASYLIRFKPLIDEQFTLYFLKTPLYWDSITKKSLGIAIPNVNATKLREIHLPLPPLPEQHRIVTRIEELFTQLDAGVVALQKTQAQLKQYRQSVLKSACEGKLVPTEAELARAEGREYEPADVLLERILKERRGNWEEEQKRKGKKSAKYKEPAAPDVSGLEELPEGWQWAELQIICETITDGDHQAPPQSEYGVPFLVISNIREGKLDFNKTRFVPESYYQSIQNHRIPEKGDILYSVVGSYGIPVLVDIDKDFCFQRHIALLKPSILIFNNYLLYSLKSDFIFKQATAAATGTAQLTVSLSGLRQIKAPLPPLAEQHRIAAEIERRLSVADAIEKTIDQSLKQAERLRQSILKEAFEGKLVPHNPDDEPASVLLERIKEEKVKREIEEINKKIIRSKIKQVNQMEKDGVDFKNAIGLHEILKSSKISLTPKELWQSSKLDIDDFYAELKTEVERGRIIERRPDDSAVFLEVGE